MAFFKLDKKGGNSDSKATTKAQIFDLLVLSLSSNRCTRAYFDEAAHGKGEENMLTSIAKGKKGTDGDLWWKLIFI